MSNDVSMWSYAARTVRDALALDGQTEAERKAKNWERNCGMDAAKLLKEARSFVEGPR